MDISQLTEQVDEGGISTTSGFTADSSTDQFLTFIMDKEEYGVDILSVQEIRGWESTTEIPNTPSYIKGVINLRGTIVPIIDLRERFNLGSAEYGPLTVVIVLKVNCDAGTRVMGIVVDAVSDVYNIPSEEVKPAPDLGSAINTQFLRGLVTVDEKMVIVLNIDKLLSLEALATLDGEIKQANP